MTRRYPHRVANPIIARTSAALWVKRSKAAPARYRPPRATTSWPRVLNLQYPTPAAGSRLDSSRISGCPDENTDPSPWTQISAVPRCRRGSARMPSSQTPSRVWMRTRETGTPGGLVIVGRSPLSRRRSSAASSAERQPAELDRRREGHQAHDDDERTGARLADEPTQERTQEGRGIHSHPIKPRPPGEHIRVRVLADHPEREHPARHAETQEHRACHEEGKGAEPDRPGAERET